VVVVVAIVDDVEPLSSDSFWSSTSLSDSTHAVVEVVGATVAAAVVVVVVGSVVVVVVVGSVVVVVGAVVVVDSSVVSSTVDSSVVVVVDPAIVVCCTTVGVSPAGPLIALATVTPPSNAPAAARATKERGNRRTGFQPRGVLLSFVMTG
jgi:hypothetical protein